MSDPVFYAPNYVVTSADKDTDEALKLAAGTTILGLTYSNMAGSGVRAHGVQDITVISGATIRSQDNGIEFVATTGTVADPNRIFNSNGFIWALTGTAISFAGGESVVLNHGAIQGVTGIKLGGTGRLDVLNSGMITASEQAIVGGSGKDRVVNTGIIHATGASDDAVAISLGLDDDFYDGSGGAVIGKIDLGEGNDKAYGGAGSEWFLGGAGDDLFDGGAGIDTVEYQGATGGIKVDLNMTTRQWIGSGQGYDTLVNIENIIGSKNNDTLIGSNGDNRLEGGKGDDILEGGDGSDTLVGGEGNDTVRYTGSANVTVDLEITTLQQISAAHGSDLLLEIENVETGSGADEIIGNDADNRISSGSGNDTLTGGKGNDTLDGGSGTNTAKYSGAKSNYTITHNANGTVTVKDNRAGAVNEGTDTLRDIRFLKFSDATHALRNAAPKDINLSRSSVEEDMGTGETVASIRANDPDGDAITYSLVSNPGNLFSISGSSLILNGKLDFETAESHTIQILAKDAYGGEAVQTFTIKVSNVIETTPVTKIGTNAGEQVLGENGNDRVYGRKGNDQVFGRKGDDLLYGEDGNDYVIGGDSATGSGAVGTGNDTIYGGKGNDTIYGGDGNDVLHGNTGKDVLYGGTGKDTFVFDSKISSSNIDHIADFKPVDDTIKLSRSIFKKMPKGTLKKDSFVVGDYFKDGNDRILYHKKFGALFYDPDGSGPAKTVQFATIAKNLSLTHKDFIIF